MNLLNYQPIFKTFANGFQITFPNLYTVIVKNGIGAQCTQKNAPDDAAELFLNSRFGGNVSPDVEVEVYDPNKKNISNKFSSSGETDCVGFVSPFELATLLYVVSNLKPLSK